MNFGKKWPIAITFCRRRCHSFAHLLDDDNDMTKFLPLIALLALSGCATSQTTYLNDGEQGLAIDCSGEANSWATCYEKADASCAGTGYRIVGTDGTPATKESDKTLGVDVGNYKNRSVVVVCK
jgi:hypothetical protein